MGRGEMIYTIFYWWIAAMMGLIVARFLHLAVGDQVAITEDRTSRYRKEYDGSTGARVVALLEASMWAAVLYTWWSFR